MSIQAFIFDLDGVLTDTAEYHFLAWKTLADQLGIPFTRDDNEHLKGVDRMGSLQFILDKGKLTLSESEKQHFAAQKNSHYQSLIDTMSEQDLFDGVNSLFNQLKQQQLKIGLASASKNAQFVVQRLGIADQFDYIADSNQITQGKPHPEIFLTVANALSVAPAQCVGIEDSLAGLRSIIDANMHSVGIGEKQVLGDADLVYGHIRECQLGQILALH